MRRAFTLLELIVIIAIVGTMVTVSVLSVQSGQAAARMRGAARDVFAAIRQARSLALVSQKPCVITFSTKTNGGEASSSVEIVSAEPVVAKPGFRARDLWGHWRNFGGDGEGDEGHTVEEVLFQPISEEVLKGVCIKVVMEGDDEAEDYRNVDEAKRSSVSAFSNVDFLIGKYREAADAAKARAAGDADGAATADSAAVSPAAAQADAAPGDEDGERSVVWQVNGRCEPHVVAVYPEGRDWREHGWKIKVDRFGAAKILSEGEDWR